MLQILPSSVTFTPDCFNTTGFSQMRNRIQFRLVTHYSQPSPVTLQLLLLCVRLLHISAVLSLGHCTSFIAHLSLASLNGLNGSDGVSKCLKAGVVLEVLKHTNREENCQSLLLHTRDSGAGCVLFQGIKRMIYSFLLSRWWSTCDELSLQLQITDSEADIRQSTPRIHPMQVENHDLHMS